MKILSTSKGLEKKWKPVLKGWLRELPNIDTSFSITILPVVEESPGIRGCLIIDTNTIILSVGSNNINEIKFCFLHEIGHWLQIIKGELSTFIWQHANGSLIYKLEHEALKFALKYQYVLSDYILKVLEVWDRTNSLRWKVPSRGYYENN